MYVPFTFLLLQIICKCIFFDLHKGYPLLSRHTYLLEECIVFNLEEEEKINKREKGDVERKEEGREERGEKVEGDTFLFGTTSASMLKISDVLVIPANKIKKMKDER